MSTPCTHTFDTTLMYILKRYAHCSLRHVRLDAHGQVHATKCAIYCAHEIIVFSLFALLFIFPVRRNFSLKDFSLKIIYRKFKMWLVVKYFRKICCPLVSSNKPLLITWFWHTFTFALSQTMYLFEANLNILANI